MAVDLSKLVYANTNNPYMDSFNKLKASYAAQRTADINTMNANRDADIQQSSAGYDNTARQNYINYMQAQKRLPSELNAMGIRGGASESSLVRLGTNYGTNVANNESARQTALSDIRKAYAQQLADYDKDYNDRIASAEATARQNQITWEREQIEKDMEYFSNAIEGLYSDKSDYKKLISKLQASNDPNKAYKIMLATRAMNALGSSGGGGGGGSRRSYGGSGYGSGGGGDNDNGNSPVSTAANIVRTTASALGSASNRGAKKSKVRTIKGDFYKSKGHIYRLGR